MNIRLIIREAIEREFACKSKLDSLVAGEEPTDFYYRDSAGETVRLDGAIIYVRFGLPAMDKKGNFINSMNHRTGMEEDGISVFEAGYDGKKIAVYCSGSALQSTYDEVMNSKRRVYIVDGDWVNSEGSDGEVLLNPGGFKIICEVPKKMIVKAV